MEILVDSLAHDVALKIVTKHQHFIGAPFIKSGEHWGTIDEVIAAPFDEINMWIFANFYAEEKNIHKALDFYKPPYFDVWLIALSNAKDVHCFSRLSEYQGDAKDSCCLMLNCKS